MPRRFSLATHGRLAPASVTPPPRACTRSGNVRSQVSPPECCWPTRKGVLNADLSTVDGLADAPDDGNTVTWGRRGTEWLRNLSVLWR